MPASKVVQSVARAADILIFVAESDEGVTLQAISQSLDLKPTTAYNLARTLTTKGLLEKVPHPVRYRLGPTFYAMVAQQAESSLRERAATAVLHLAEHFPQATVTYCEPIANEIMTVLRISPERPGVLERPRNRMMQPYVNACTLIFQAFWSPEQRLAYTTHHSFYEYGAQVWRTREALDLFLSEAREAGYVVRPHAEVIPIAMPVFSRTQELIGTLGIAQPMQTGYDADRMIGDIVNALKKATEDLAAASE